VDPFTGARLSAWRIRILAAGEPQQQQQIQPEKEDDKN
jgi:hypothetical protein